MNKREMNLTTLIMTGWDWDWRNEREMGTLQAQIL